MTVVKLLNKIKRQHYVMGQHVAQFEADITRQTLGNVQDFERLKVPTPAFCEHEFRHDQVNFVMKKNSLFCPTQRDVIKKYKAHLVARNTFCSLKISDLHDSFSHEYEMEITKHGDHHSKRWRLDF